MISFSIDWFDLLAVQETLKSLLQHHSSKASIFLALNLHYGPNLTSMHDYWKNHNFDYADFVGKVMSLLFSMLARLVIVFLPRSKGLLISWLQSLFTVILEPKKKAFHCFHCFPSICHEVRRLRAVILVSWMLSFKLAFSGSLVPLHFPAIQWYHHLS